MLFNGQRPKLDRIRTGVIRAQVIAKEEKSAQQLKAIWDERKSTKKRQQKVAWKRNPEESTDIERLQVDCAGLNLLFQQQLRDQKPAEPEKYVNAKRPKLPEINDVGTIFPNAPGCVVSPSPSEPLSRATRRA